MDAEAKAATRLDMPGRPVSLSAVKPIIRNCVNDGEIKHSRTREVYACKSKKKDKLLENRSDQVTLARLRSGHHPALWTYKHRLNPAKDPSCQRCREADIDGRMLKPYALDNIGHLLECPGTAAYRMNIFGRVNVDLSILTEDPRGSVALARRALRGTGREETSDHH